MASTARRRVIERSRSISFMWYVYIVRCEDGSLYTGISDNVDNRFKNHRAGRGGHYTKTHKPVEILYAEQYQTKGEALKRECQIKGWRRDKKKDLIKSRLAL